MSLIKIDSIKNVKVYPKLFFYKKGTTAFVYKISNDEVLKVYRDTLRKKAIFSARDMNDILNRLSFIKLDSFITPNDIYIDEEENILGYSMNLVKGYKSNRINSMIKLREVVKAVKKLDEDNRILSKNKYLIRDLHEKNMVYDMDGYKVFDLDGGYFNLEENSDTLYKINNHFLKKTIVKGLFGIRAYNEINIIDYDINDYYCDANIVDMIELLGEKTRKSDPTVGDVRRLSKRISYVYDDYYDKW